MEDILLSYFIITILNAFESCVLFIIINNSKKIINIPESKTVYSDKISKLSIINFFGKKYYNLNITNNLINRIHIIDNIYRFILVLFFSIYVGILVGGN